LETEESRVRGQPELHNETLFQKKQNQQTNNNKKTPKEPKANNFKGSAMTFNVSPVVTNTVQFLFISGGNAEFEVPKE
jgi:hypothetical protein